MEKGHVLFLVWLYPPGLVVQDESPQLCQVGKAMSNLPGCNEDWGKELLKSCHKVSTQNLIPLLSVIRVR